MLIAAAAAVVFTDLLDISNFLFHFVVVVGFLYCFFFCECVTTLLFTLMTFDFHRFWIWLSLEFAIDKLLHWLFFAYEWQQKIRSNFAFILFIMPHIHLLWRDLTPFLSFCHLDDSVAMANRSPFNQIRSRIAVFSSILKFQPRTGIESYFHSCGVGFFRHRKTFAHTHTHISPLAYSIDLQFSMFWGKVVSLRTPNGMMLFIIWTEIISSDMQMRAFRIHRYTHTHTRSRSHSATMEKAAEETWRDKHIHTHTLIPFKI